MMATCPKCGKNITYLRDFSKAWEEYKLMIGEDGIECFIPTANFIPADQDEYECPECEKVIFRDTTEAIEFLKGVNDEATR